MLKGALVGFGQVAEKAHLPAWLKAPGFSIAAVAEESQQRRDAAARLVPGARIYPSLDALLDAEDGLDFVDIATPPFLHARQASQALRRGLHVLCEKPLALSTAELAGLLELSEPRRLAVFCAHNWKRAPLLEEAARLAGSGVIGRPSHAELHTLRSQPARAAGENWRTRPELSGGGILADHGWHGFYLLRELLGADPLSVAARLAFPEGRGEGEDEASCLLVYPSATAALHMSWRSPRRSNWGIVYGSQGSLELRDDHILAARGDSPARRLDFPEPLSRGSAHPHWFLALLEEFRLEITDPARRGQNLARAASCVALLEAAYASHRRGGAAVLVPARQEAARA